MQNPTQNDNNTAVQYSNDLILNTNEVFSSSTTNVVENIQQNIVTINKVKTNIIFIFFNLFKYKKEDLVIQVLNLKFNKIYYFL
jgi:hypothetical protein